MDINSHTIPYKIQKHLPGILRLCLKHKLKRLWVFGSVLGPTYRADSDVDFLYVMDEKNIKDEESYDCFWGFYDALKKLLDREIDLVWYDGIKNPYFKEEVDETKILIYDQEAEKIFI